MSLTGYNPYTYAPGFRNQEFHHAVLSVSGTWHTLYLDGVQVAQNLSGGNIFASYKTITNTVIGAQTTLSQAFQGTIGDVRVYNYAIPQTLITSLYRDRELVVYYPFDTSVNSLTPNYATLIYDASLIGQPLITASAGANVGSGALALTNSATTVATQYVKTTPGILGQVGWNLDVTHGITIACWINVAGVAGRVQRIFDIPLSVNQKGLAVDISGTNMLYSGWNAPVVVDILNTAYVYLPLTTNTANLGTSGNSVTVVGPPVISNQLGKACTFFDNAATTGAGTQNPPNGRYITAPFLSNNTTDFTIGGWIYAFTGYYNPWSIFNGNTVVHNPDIGLNSNNRIQIFVQQAAAFSQVGADITSYSFTTQWVHVILVRPSPSSGNGNCVVYINGQSVGSSSLSKGNTVPSTLLIGGGSTITAGNQRGFKGYLRHYTAFNRALSSAEVLNLYNATINLNYIDNILSEALIYFPLQSGTISNLGTLGANCTITQSATYRTVGAKTGLADNANALLVKDITISGSYTICVWMYKTTDGKYPFGTYSTNAYLGGNLNTIAFDNASGTVRIYYKDLAGAIVSFALSTWNHIAIVVDSVTKTEYIYINGTQITTANLTSITLSDIKAFQFPHFPNSSSNATIRNLMIYNSALTAAQINTIYKATD
jgi:hypothetical protein